MKITEYLALLDDAEDRMRDAFELLASRHAADAEIRDMAHRLATWSDAKRAALRPAIERYGRARSSGSDLVYRAMFRQPRIGGFGQVRDLHDASLFVHHVFLCWTAVGQAAQALRDKELIGVCKREIVRTERQARWLRTMFLVGTPQALTIVPDKGSELKATLQGMKPRLAAAASMLAVGALGAVAIVLAATRRG
jgi:hypothetical protein